MARVAVLVALDVASSRSSEPARAFVSRRAGHQYIRIDSKPAENGTPEPHSGGISIEVAAVFVVRA
jgi:hypothetical protein